MENMALGSMDANQLEGLITDMVRTELDGHRALQAVDPADFAALQGDAAAVAGALDTFWLLYCGAIVFLMQAGFCIFEAGSLREKNIKNIMMKNILDPAIGGLGFYIFGFGLAYGNKTGTGGYTLYGDDYWFLSGGFEDEQSWHGFFFQFVFAATAATIVSGAVAERCQIIGYVCYSFFLTAFVYPIVVHQIWSTNGFLVAWPDEGEPFNGVGVIDFAGCGVVHMVGGVAALIGAAVLGPRAGRFDPLTGKIADEMPAHNTALVVLGTFILWFGWYGFNPGSTLMIVGVDSVAAKCAVTTTLAGAAGALTNCILHKFLSGILSLEQTCSGVLAGLVGITSACSVVDTGTAMLCGVGGAVFCTLGEKLNLKLKIDDPVNASGVHFYAGMWGLMAPALFASEANMSNAYGITGKVGIFYGGADMIVPQAVAVAFVVGWTTVCMLPFFLILKKTGMFRVPLEVETVGMDASEHGGAGYKMDHK